MRSVYADAPPPPPPPDEPSGGPRYVYLLGRLRNRQITMEEATELFAVQQSMIRRAGRGTPAPTPATAGAASKAAAPASSVGSLPPLSDDGLAFALLAIATGAGVLAAVLKRGRGDPPRAATAAR